MLRTIDIIMIVIVVDHFNSNCFPPMEAASVGDGAVEEIPRLGQVCETNVVEVGSHNPLAMPFSPVGHFIGEQPFSALSKPHANIPTISTGGWPLLFFKLSLFRRTPLSCRDVIKQRQRQTKKKKTEQWKMKNERNNNVRGGAVCKNRKRN